MTHFFASVIILLTGWFYTKLLYLDCETAGLEPKKNPIIQISGIIEVDSLVVKEFNFKLRPLPTDLIDPKALEVNGIKAEELQDPDRLEPIEVYKKLKSIFLTYIDRYDKSDKLYLMGQNVGFDYGFLLELWKRQGDDYLGSFIHYHKIDLIALTCSLKLAGKIGSPEKPLPNMKLATLCEYFGLGEQTHDSMDDIRKTREIFLRIVQSVSKSNLSL